MSDTPFKVVGGIPNDPRVKAQLDKIENAGEEGSVEAMTSPDVPATPLLSAAGIKIRTPGLAHDLMLHRIMRKAGTMSMEECTLAWIYTACAPLAEVYAALAKMDREGYFSMIVAAHEWWDSRRLPHGVAAEVGNAVEHSFRIIAKVTEKESKEDATRAGDEVKKKAPPGNASPPTPFSPSTAGASVASGGE